MDKTLKDVLSDDFWIMPATPEFVSEGIPYITSKNIKCGKIDFSKINYISQDDFKTISRNRPIQIGDILISMIGTLGEIAEVTVDDGKFYGQNMFLIRLDEKQINKRYFFNFFNSNRVKRDLTSKMNQSTQKYLKANHIEDLIIPVLAMDEQKEIAEKLDTLQSIITHRRQQLSKLDQLVKARFVEMFGKSNFPKITISELVEKRISSAKKDFEQHDIIKYIDISSINNQQNIMTGYTEYILSEAPSRAQQHIIKNDIVISTVRPNLRNVAITIYNDDNLVASSGFCVLRAIKCLPSYLMAIVCSNEFTETMSKLVTGANYPAIKNSDILKYIVSLPPIELQTQFADFVTQTEKIKSKVKESIDKSQTLFDSLMQEYFG